MNHAALHGRRLFSSGTLTMFVAAGIVLLAIFAVAPGGTPPMAPVAVLASVGLVDDDGHQGLFNVSGLVPGRSATRCLRVRYGGPAPAGTVFFSATDITGPLAANLRIKVEQGTGGSFSSCTGFAGATTVYDGPLTSLVDTNPAAPRTTTGWSPAASDERTFRLTATLRDTVSAQGQTSTATFHWFLVGGPTATPAPAATTTTPATEPTVVPTLMISDPPTAAVEGSATPTPGAAVPAVPGRPAGVPATRGTTAPRGDTPAAAEPVDPDESPVVAKVRKVLEDIGRDITEVAVRTSSHGALPVTGIAVLIVFLGVQNRIDRMDPKLAMAPAQDPHLEFREPDKDPDSASEPAP